MPHIETGILDVAFECGGPESGSPVLLLHGWPDDVGGWRKITPALEIAGFRWVAPWLRGFGPTRLHTPTLMIQGAEDRCDPPPGESADDERYFPAREAPVRVAEEIVALLRER